MRPRITPTLLASRGVLITIAVLFVTTLPAMAQHGAPLDANSCFSSLLQNHYDFSQHEDIKFRLFSLWNRDLYEESKINGGILTPYGAGNLDTSQSKVWRELQENNQSLDYNKVTAIHVASLDPQAKEIIDDCLKRLTSGYGAFTTVEVEDERYLNLTIYWRDPSGNPLKIKKQELFNGNVVDDHGSHPTVPFVSGSRWSDYQIPSGSSRSVRVERTGPYQRVIFSFVVSPDISFEKIYVDPVPEKVTYTKKYLNVDTHGPLYREWIAATWVNNDTLVQTWDDGAGHKHYRWTRNISDITDDPTAAFSYVLCEKSGPFSDLDGATPPWAGSANGQGVNTKQAVCSGWWQNTGVNVKMRTWVTITGYDSTSHTWEPWYPPASPTGASKKN